MIVKSAAETSFNTTSDTRTMGDDRSAGDVVDQAFARAAVEAGYLSVADYIALCAKNDWSPVHPAGHLKPERSLRP